MPITIAAMAEDEARREHLHRTHCPLCAAEDGAQPQGAAHFVAELYRVHAPRVALPPERPSLRSLVSGDGTHRPKAAR